MSNLIDPIDAIKAAPIGAAVYGRAAFDGGAMQTTLFIRIHPRGIIALMGKDEPITVQLKFATFEIGTVSVGFLLAKTKYTMGSELFETVWNYHQPDGIGVRHFDDMSTQDMLPILFYDGEKLRRSIQVKNRLQRAFANAKARCEALPAWSMQDFDRARDVVYQRLPEVSDLWRAIS